MKVLPPWTMWFPVIMECPAEGNLGCSYLRNVAFMRLRTIDTQKV
jgi:hypothetical protein